MPLTTGRDVKMCTGWRGLGCRF